MLDLWGRFIEIEAFAGHRTRLRLAVATQSNGVQRGASSRGYDCANYKRWREVEIASFQKKLYERKEQHLIVHIQNFTWQHKNMYKKSASLKSKRNEDILYIWTEINIKL